MKKLVAYSLVGLLTLSCSVSAPNNSPNVRENYTALAEKYNFADLEKEYKSFSTKALSDAYVLRMFNKFLTESPNPTQVIRQLEFARYLKDFKSDSTYFNSLSTIIGNDASVYTKITGITQVSQKMSTEPSTFGTFVQSLSPFPGVPVTTSATNVTASGFTANWNAVSNATGYILTVTQGANSTNYPLGVVTTYNVTGLSGSTNYSYTVKAVNANGTSNSSNSTSVTTIAGINVYNVTTFAGSTLGFFDAQGTNAQFNTPYGMTMDNNGNLYVADTENNRIRKIDSSGNVTTVAGSSQGFANGNGTNALFYWPAGIVRDNNGNLYVTEQKNHRVRKIDTSGNVTTVAGSSQGFADGTNALFNGITGIAIDNSGNLYITDYYNYRVRKISTSGNVTTIAGSSTQGSANGNGTNAQFSSPGGITRDSSGNLFVTDSGNNSIRKIDTAGNVTTFAGGSIGFADGNRTNAKFNSPVGLIIDNSGNLLVVDQENNRIRKIDSYGNVTTVAGDGISGNTDAPGTYARFYLPSGITMESNGNLYVSDYMNRRIRKIRVSPIELSPTPPVANSASNVVSTSFTANWSPVSGATGYVLSVSDSGGYYSEDFLLGNVNTYNIIGLAPGTNLSYTVKTINDVGLSASSNSVSVTTSNSAYTVSTIAGSSAGNTNANGTSAQFNGPYGLLKDSSDNIYVTDYYNQRIRKIDPSGNVTTFAGSSIGFTNSNGTNAQFNWPAGIVKDNSGNLFIAEQANHCIRKIDASGNVTTFAGGSQGTTDAQGTNAKFKNPTGLVRDNNGNLYVTDYSNNRIRKIDTTGNVTTFAGSTQGSADGNGTNALFFGPAGINRDNNGNIYVTDMGNNRVRKIASNGDVTTIAGNTYGFANGNGTNALFKSPAGIAIDKSGNLYVADQDNNRIRKIDSARNVTTVAGDGTSGITDTSGTSARFNAPGLIFIDSNGNLFIADISNNRIRKITL